MPIDVFINGTKVGEYIGEPIVEGPDYCSIEQVKERALLSLDDSTHDEQIDTCIQEASRFIDDKIRKYVAAVPLTTVPDSIVAAAADLACALFQRRHLPEQYNAAWWTSGLDKLQTYIEGLKHQGYFYVGEGTAEPEVAEVETDAAKESTLTAIKGTGWSSLASLKAIKDAIDGMGGGAGTATIEKQNQALDGTTNLSGGWDAATDNFHDVNVLVEAIKAKTDVIGATVALESGGNLAAVKTKTDLIGASVALEGAGNLAAVKAKTDLIPADITTQLDTNVPAIKAKTDLIPADITTQLDTNIPAIKAKTDVIVSGGATESNLNTKTGRIQNHLVTRTFFSPSQISVTLTASAGDKTLPSVVLPDIAGTIVSVKAGFKFRMVENTNATANKLAGAQEIQVKENAAGSFIDAINFVDDQFGVAATTREGGDCILGTIDVVAQVATFNKTYDFQWDEGVADLANLVFFDVQTFLIVSYY